MLANRNTFLHFAILIRCCSFRNGEQARQSGEHHRANGKKHQKTEHNMETKMAKTALHSNVQDKQRANLESLWIYLEFQTSQVHLCMCMHVHACADSAGVDYKMR